MIDIKMILRMTGVVLTLAVMWGLYSLGHHNGYQERDLIAVKQAAELTRQRDIAREATNAADLKLAALQASAAQDRTQTIIKKQVIYRDKIKNDSIASCVGSSGLLDLYDASLGLSNS